MAKRDRETNDSIALTKRKRTPKPRNYLNYMVCSDLEYRPSHIQGLSRPYNSYQLKEYCEYCGEQDKTLLEKEHIIPYKKNEIIYEDITNTDINSYRNQMTLCRNCHKKKSDRWDDYSTNYMKDWIDILDKKMFVFALQKMIRDDFTKYKPEY